MEQEIVIRIPDWLVNFPRWAFIVIWLLISYLVIGPFFSRAIVRNGEDRGLVLIFWVFAPITNIFAIAWCLLHKPIYWLVVGEKWKN